MLGRAVLGSDFTQRKRRVHLNVSATVRGVRKLAGWGAAESRIVEDLSECAKVVTGMFVRVRRLQW